MNFRCRLLTFLWASAELLPPIPLRLAFCLSCYPTGVKKPSPPPQKCYLISKGLQIKWRFYEEVLSRIIYSTLKIKTYPFSNHANHGLFWSLLLVWKIRKKHFCRMVDWSGASVTPRGFSVSEETLERTQRLIGRPLERTAGGTEINLSQVFLSY